MMCMECFRDYVQQASNARDTFDFCSIRCEFKHTFPVESENPHTAGVVQSLQKQGMRPA